ncbi:MAG: hypothetical protein HY923_11610 [Elusimicrobia bacterium]|nr:hypothetical protein [Elusimicrobiota bacterium]
MKRILLAALLLQPAFARAESALGSLVGMAASAAEDKGPDAGETPKDEAKPAQGSSTAPAEEMPASEQARARVESPRPEPARTPQPSRKDDDGPSVAVPASQPPRIWTRLFASLLPPLSRSAAFEVEASTEAPRALPAPTRPATPASAAGSAQGLREFVALATAPSAD